MLAADFGDIDPIAFKEKLATAKQKIEQAEAALFKARESAGLDEERLTLPDRWSEMTVAERRRARQSFDVVAYVDRGRQPVDQRVTIEMRAAPIGDGWEPDVKYTWPSIEPEKIAAWDAKYADGKFVIKPVALSEEDEAAADKLFTVAA